jgi:hypothetical protein
MPYRDVLERLYVLDPLPGWKPTRNHIARLTEPSKHHLAELGSDLVDAVVITSGTEAYRRADGIAVVPAALLGP